MTYKHMIQVVRTVRGAFNRCRLANTAWGITGCMRQSPLEKRGAAKNNLNILIIVELFAEELQVARFFRAAKSLARL